MSLATEHRFAFYLATGMVQQGWIFVAQEQAEEGLATMRQGLAALRSTGAGGLVAEHLAWLAEAYGQVGQIGKGLSTLDEALDLVNQTEERWCEAELYRLRGELVRNAECSMRRAVWTPVVCFQHALDVARRQQAKSWELRAAPAWLACGSSRASAPRPTRCWHRSTAGSPRALTPPTSRRPRRCWRIWGIAQEKIAVRYSIIAHILTISEV